MLRHRFAVLGLVLLFATCALCRLEGPDGPVSFTNSNEQEKEESDGHVWHMVKNNEVHNTTLFSLMMIIPFGFRSIE